ncbi:MAG TPA: methyltransferase [Burkholderiaceae bacterium]|nr:methyltransferase [Burkholderiaceae bacterium]
MERIDTREQMLDAIHASWTTQVIAAAVALRVPDLLSAAPLDAPALAGVARCHEPSLRRLLVALVSLGLVTQREDERFALTASGVLLRNDELDSLAAWALLCGQRIWTAQGRLAECVCSGASARTLGGGSDDFAHLDSDDEAAALFHRAMTNLTRPIAEALAATVDFGAARRVVDIGGGYGQLIATLLRAHRHLRGVLVDLPHAIGPAATWLAEQGVEGRCELVSGSFFDALPEGADAYLLKSVLHDWDDERCLQILQRCRGALGGRPQARLFVIERVANERAAATPHDRAVARSDLNMLVCLGGRERRASEYQALLNAVGLRALGSHTLVSGYSAIEAAPG